MKRAHKTNGFTLIELITVIAILGVLSALAISQYASYRKKGQDALANGDLKNAAIAEESLYATDQIYVTCNGIACETALPGFRLSNSVQIGMRAVTSANPSFTGTTTTPLGTGRTFAYDSTLGGFQ